MSKHEPPDQDGLVVQDESVHSSVDPALFDLLKEAASRVLRRRFRIVLLVRRAYDRMLAHSDVLSAVLDDLRTMLRLVVQWGTRSYQKISWTPLLLIVGALIYFITPVDAIPDALGALGFVDDVAVITTIVRKIRDELDRFRRWEEDKALPE